MGNHATVTHRTERAQTLPISSVHLGHSEVAEVALSEEQILPPQGGTVWVEEHLQWNKRKRALERSLLLRLYYFSTKSWALTSFFHSLARSEGSQSSWQILSLSSCRVIEQGLVATARSAMLSFFSRSARWEHLRRSAGSLPCGSSSAPNTAALSSSFRGRAHGDDDF